MILFDAHHYHDPIRCTQGTATRVDAKRLKRLKLLAAILILFDALGLVATTTLLDAHTPGTGII